MKKQVVFFVAAILLLSATACRRAAAPVEVSAPPTRVATSIPIEPSPTGTSEPAPAATATIVIETPPAEMDNSPVFDTPWDDRAVYAAGLIDSRQGVENALPGAPVYHLDLTIADSLTEVDGRLALRYTNQEDETLSELYFHLFPNLLDGAIDVSGVAVNGRATSPQLEENDSVMRVPLDAPLQPGEQATVELSFRTKVPTDPSRNYGIFTFTDGVLTLAHFYPMLAVYDETGWNITPPDIEGDVTYSDTGFYLARVTAPRDLVMAASGVAIDGEETETTQTVTYAAGPMRDFYLAAGEDYVVTTQTVDDVTVNSYAPASLQAGSDLALGVAAAALRQHSRRFGPYPFRELDVVGTPTLALGVEYPGIIANTLRIYDVDAKTAGGVPLGVILESTTAHEVGHQWFYSLIGNDQLDEPWLDEALTQYATYLYYLDRYGRQGAEAYYDSLEGRWERVDREEIPIGLPVAAYEEGAYSPIVYGRGPIFLRTLAETVGQDTFDAFLRDYYDQYLWGRATTEGFRSLLEQHCACDLGALFDRWVYK